MFVGGFHYSSKELANMIASCVTKSIKRMLETASFDKSTIGVITAKNGNDYTVAAFGSEYTISTKLAFSVYQKVAVVAPQGNFSKLYMIAI